MTQTRFFSSVAQPSTLQSNITPSTTAIPLTTSPIGYPVSTPFTIAIDYGNSLEELCDVTAVAGSIFTVTRAVDGTSAASHNVGAVIRHVSSARDFNDMNAHINLSTGVHGIAGGSSVVGTTDAQTLTNKTLASPIITGTIAGTLTVNALAFGVGSVAGTGFTSTDLAYEAKVSGDTSDRFKGNFNGDLSWGPGNAPADTFLARSSAGTLTVNNNLTVSNTFSAANYPSTGWLSFTPAWTTSTGLHTPSIGNGSLAMRYMQHGKTVFWTMMLKAGTTTNYNAGTSSDNWTFSLPIAAAAGVGTGGGGASFPIATGSITPTGSDNKIVASVAYLATASTFNIQTSSGEADAIAVVSTGYIDAASPVAWTTAGYLTLMGQYESV